MAKVQDFAKKVEKAGMERGLKCPKCSTLKVPTLYIDSVKTPAGTFRFNRSMVQVCKCNEKAVYE